MQYNNKEMGLAKTEIFTDEQNAIAAFAKAFAHPARVSILQHLYKINSCVCGDLVEEIGLAQPTISQHLKELKNLGLIKGSVEGTSVCYCIDTENWTAMKNLMSQFLDQDLTNKQDCC
ncbi:transcriptional regulator, ArsR family protein [Leeuwenhoekiella blandensis MED217]|uniref:Transcriptional regulator, ArsR family protein n=2 Tax=Flavobacteriaceae TaxID=49546 RepID=A3XH18_LEEBM|nr:transcriptional regulator, ArsR family protein [Leeuwenhoekiella blandensis MED217]